MGYKSTIMYVLWEKIQKNIEIYLKPINTFAKLINCGNYYRKQDLTKTVLYDVSLSNSAGYLQQTTHYKYNALRSLQFIARLTSV